MSCPMVSVAPTHVVYPLCRESSIKKDHTGAQTRKPLAALSFPADRSLVIPENCGSADLSEVIVEEGEETASELVEPLTPIDSEPLATLKDVFTSDANSYDPPSMTKSIILNTEATPLAAPQTTRPSVPRPSPLRTASHSLKSLFRRSTSHPMEELIGQALNVSPIEVKNGEKCSMPPKIPSAPAASPTTSQSNTPPSPSSPSSTLNGGMHGTLSPSSPTEVNFLKKQNRSSTGLSLRGRSKIVFGATPKPQHSGNRIRSPSLSDVRNQPERPGFSIPAAAGVGLKARRMSASLPDDFYVDTCDLSEEYVSASKVPGRRGKEIGKGATATVKIMCRKGSTRNAHYAVKEFRKRGQKEDEQEYVKKVKSEFSIANSLHHPNIVQTFRLCTHGDRWNHVMEYCSYGELFSLVQKNYLTTQDNLCFFKQVVRGVGYLHDKGIAHRDIKLENLLLSDEGFVKITDFGVSEVFSGIHPGLRSAGGVCGKEMNGVRLCSPGICGSLPYIAPEVLAKNGDYDPRPLDVWSCAIVFLTLQFRGNPWPSADRKNANYSKFIDGWDEFLSAHPDGLVTEDDVPKCGPVSNHIRNPGAKRLILQMLHPDPKKRISIHEVLNGRFYKAIECCAPELPNDPSKIVTTIDAAGKGCCKLASKMLVQKIHNHFPPERKLIPQHRFDLGDGY